MFAREVTLQCRDGWRCGTIGKSSGEKKKPAVLKEVQGYFSRCGWTLTVGKPGKFGKPADTHLKNKKKIQK